jgi:hypothetical protein
VTGAQEKTEQAQKRKRRALNPTWGKDGVRKRLRSRKL